MESMGGLDITIGWDPDTQIVVKSNNVVFNENKRHNQFIKQIEMRKLVFKDIVPFVNEKERTPLM